MTSQLSSQHALSSLVTVLKLERSYQPSSRQVEAFASHFRSITSRITVRSPIDTTTLAVYFVRGLQEKLAKVLAAHCSLVTLQELDPIISAAEEMEAKPKLASKQYNGTAKAHPQVATVTAHCHYMVLHITCVYALTDHNPSFFGEIECMCHPCLAQRVRAFVDALIWRRKALNEWIRECDSPPCESVNECLDSLREAWIGAFTMFHQSWVVVALWGFDSSETTVIECNFCCKVQP